MRIIHHTENLPKLVSVTSDNANDLGSIEI